MSSSAAKPISLYRSLSDLRETTRGAVLAIGNFDGVHLGHQQVIADARALAAAKNVPLGVMLFDPHPQQFFAPDAPPFRLTRLVTRAALLADLGVDFTLALPFDATMAACEAEDFISDILLAQLGVSAVCVGYDFCFGKGRRGNFAMLQDLAAKWALRHLPQKPCCNPTAPALFHLLPFAIFCAMATPNKPPN